MIQGKKNTRDKSDPDTPPSIKKNFGCNILDYLSPIVGNSLNEEQTVQKEKEIEHLPPAKKKIPPKIIKSQGKLGIPHTLIEIPTPPEKPAITSDIPLNHQQTFSITVTEVLEGTELGQWTVIKSKDSNGRIFKIYLNGHHGNLWEVGKTYDIFGMVTSTQISNGELIHILKPLERSSIPTRQEVRSLTNDKQKEQEQGRIILDTATPWRNKLFLLVFYHFLRLSPKRIVKMLSELGSSVSGMTITNNAKKLNLSRTPNELYVCIYYLLFEYSIRDTAKIFDSTHTTVMGIITRNGFETRTRTESALLRHKKSLSSLYNIPITPEFRELLYGSVAADGTMPSGVNTSGYEIKLKWESREYLLHFHAQIAEASGYTVKIFERQVPCVNDDNDTVSMTIVRVNYSVQLKALEEKFYRDLTPQEKELYPDRKRMKVLPPDFFITPRLCTYLYLEDGRLSKQHYTNINGETSTHWFVEICTDNFDLSDVERLCTLLIAEIRDSGIEPYLVTAHEVQLANGRTITPKKDVYHRIRFDAEASRKFFDYIGWKSPVSCFDYKYPPEPTI